MHLGYRKWWRTNKPPTRAQFARPAPHDFPFWVWKLGFVKCNFPSGNIGVPLV